MSLESICNLRLFVRYFRVDFYLFYAGNSGLFSNSTYKNMPHWNCSVDRAKNSQSPSSLTFRIRHKQQKKSHKFWVFHSWSWKRDSVHLLSTLYIKQLPLPSTILPIRGTLGLFQGVVFESDFCHTNFRTTVAYDKFTNNFWIDKIEERWPLFVATSLRFTEH